MREQALVYSMGEVAREFTHSLFLSISTVKGKMPRMGFGVGW
jgi:hypothetical protein